MEPLIIGTNGSVSAVDPTTGEIQWTTPLKTHSIVSSTRGQDVSVLVRGRIIFAGAYGYLFCLDADTGNILWSNPLKGLGHNDISLAMDGVAVQFLTKTVSSNSPS
jgi:outer membrane protein assembly factor BamB